MFSSRSVPGSRHLPGATWVAIAVLALAACSPSASASSTAESAAASAELPAESAAASTAASPSEPAVGGDTTVTISGNSFGGDFTISAGSTVTFVNNDSVGHTVTNGENGVAAADALFDEPLADGGTFEFTFDTPGVYQVTCKIHTTMNLTITVQ
ncbi:MAG: plastocyanin/azurin family copper-binding protein [Chloroflexota bacterium]|nr:plastocyanin/azurin family copper-binding protein [Chloroflexota bacterium]